MKELRFDPEIDEVVTFSEFAYFHGNQLSEEEKIELWFQNELAIGVAADFPEDDDFANDVDAGFGLGLGSSDKEPQDRMCVLDNDASHSVEHENPEGCESGHLAKQYFERRAAGAVGEIKTDGVASKSAPGTASSFAPDATMDELRAAMDELHAAMLLISFAFPQPDARELPAAMDELHAVMLQISFRDRGIGTACA